MFLSASDNFLSFLCTRGWGVGQQDFLKTLAEA
jgi:hypothetical protein